MENSVHMVQYTFPSVRMENNTKLCQDQLQNTMRIRNIVSVLF